MKRLLPLAALLLLSSAAMPAFAQTAFDDPTAGMGATGGSLVAVQPEVAAGTIALGSNAQVIVRFRNEASQAVTFGEINLYPSSNVSATIASDGCKALPLQFGGECAIVMSIKALKAGSFRTEMLVQHSGRSKLITASISGEVAAADANAADQSVGEIQASPMTLDFGDIEASRPTLRTIQLRNITSETLTVSSVNLDSPQKTGFDVRHDCKELAPGQSCLISVVWSPLLQGPTSGFLVINHSGTSKVMNIPVEGDYKPAAVEDVSAYPEPIPGMGLLVSSATEMDFEEEVDSEVAKTVTLVNDGDADLKITGLSMSVPVAGLNVDPNGCASGTVLKPTEACALTVRWAPQRVGKLATDLRVKHNGTRGVFVLPIKGRSTAIAQGVSASGLLPSYDNGGDEIGSSTGGINTDLPGSAGLTLSDIESLNAVMDGSISDVIDRASGRPDSATRGNSARVNASASTLANYIVTSHSINRAVVLGPNGSRVVTHNKPFTLNGASWTPEITPDSVQFKADGRVVTLAFDQSLSTNQSLLTDNSQIIYSEDADTMTSREARDQAIEDANDEDMNKGATTVAPNSTISTTPTAATNRRPSQGLPDIFNDGGNAANANSQPVTGTAR